MSLLIRRLNIPALDLEQTSFEIYKIYGYIDEDGTDAIVQDSDQDRNSAIITFLERHENTFVINVNTAKD